MWRWKPGRRLAAGLLSPRNYDLNRLADREVRYRDGFICKGGKSRCDRRCEIAVIELEGKRHPFGGACSRYDNIRSRVRVDTGALNLVRQRQRLVFEPHVPPQHPGSGQRVAINRSFLVNTYFPLYATFFHQLGLWPVLPEQPSREGINRRNAPFCYPGELTHGFFHSLITDDPPPDVLFLPHFKAVPAGDGNANSQVCPLVQGEPFYLRATFKKELDALKKRGTRVFTPLLDLTGGLAQARKPLLGMAREMGFSPKTAAKAFHTAARRQRECLDKMKALGRKALAELEADPDLTAVVLFGRPYNAFAEETHMGIPHKFASRGVRIIPMDFLPLENEPSKRHMYWGMGRQNLKAARFVARHPQLFGCFVTNFSCGPDSFLVGYFRDIMGRKPSLILELDSHSADAGLETRIEAFLDIVGAYLKLAAGRSGKKHPTNAFKPAQVLPAGKSLAVHTSAGERLTLSDPRVTLLFPSMGKLGSEAFAAVARRLGIHAKAHEPADEAVLKLGRGSTTCKECLPLILTTGTLLNYARHHKRADEVVVYFMPTGCGPCRFGQYYIFMEDLVKKQAFRDVALLTLSGDNSYLGMDKTFEKRAWWGLAVADVMEDIRAMILANASDPAQGKRVFNSQWHEIITVMETGEFSDLEHQLARTARKLAGLPLKQPPSQVPKVALTGEIFVRRDQLSRQFLTERLAEKGFAVTCAPVIEWVHYTNYLVEKGIGHRTLTPYQKLRLIIRNRFMAKWERRIKHLLSASGLVTPHPVNMNSILGHGAALISPHLQGEAILTVGSAMADIATHACGVIAIGPFGCMPNRLSEAILTETMNAESKLSLDAAGNGVRACLSQVEELPFLAIESDGSPFPQLITAKLEAFCLRAERLHGRMMKHHDD